MALASESATTRFYVQLVRGTDESQPPASGCRRVGPKLAEQFQAVFRLKHYWEIDQKEIAVAPGKVNRVQLSPERIVEIDLSEPEKRKVTVLQGRTVLDRMIRPTGEAMTLIGGKRDGQSIWFVVVRRDRPGS